MLTDEDKSVRKGRITGTRIGKICGLSKYGGPFDAWLEIKGLKPEQEETPDMRRGNFLEPALRSWYASEHRMIAQPVKARVHPKLDFLAATPDSLVRPVDTKDWDRVNEIKSPRFGDDWGTDGTDDIPDYHVAQAALEMAVFDLPRNDVVAFVYGDLRVYPIARDEELEGLLLERAQKFWVDHVLADTPPGPDGSEQCDRYLRARFEEHRGEMLDADAKASQWAAQLRRARAMLGVSEKLEEEAKQNLMAIIGNAAGIAAPDWKITWKKSKDSYKVDWEALAKHLGATEEIIKEFTKTHKGARRFVVPRSWKKEPTDGE